jgi:hypothetical protein
LPYLAKLEKAGIPTVLIDLEDQVNMVEEWALAQGVPKMRYVHASRTVAGPEDVDNFFEPIIEALTRPLTEEEKESGRWVPPQQRIIFEGTLDEAEIFYQQTKEIPFPVNAPIATYTDGYPIRVPTEERVREMLAGTSHNPDELITHQSDRPGMRGGRKGDPVLFQPSIWRTATVEKVAINAVMAGCKPEHLPVVLAIAESGCFTGTTGNYGQWVCVSGPIAKEIKMNFGCGMFEPGNPANATIGRAYQLMAINLGGAIPGVTRMASQGNPFNTGGTCCAENVDGLPPAWKGLNEEYGYKKDESVVMVMFGSTIRSAEFAPGVYRALQKSGHGGIARFLDVKGVPGPHNWLEYITRNLWAGREGAVTLIMVPEMAQHLYEYGFKSKEEVYEWLWKKSFEPLKDFRLRGAADFRTNGWMGIEKMSGKHWKELDDDYMVPVGGDAPFENCLIIAGGQEEACLILSGRSVASSSVHSIDAWR